MFLAPATFWGRTLVFAVLCLPAVIPGVISAISLRIFIRSIGLPGTFAIILGHTIHNVPFVALMVFARLGSMPRSHVEAARDLGADDFIAFMRVTLPYLVPSLVSAGVFCMLHGAATPRILWNGTPILVDGAQAQAIADRSRVDVTLRPESIRLTVERPDAANALRTRIVRRTFKGARLDVDLEVEGGRARRHDTEPRPTSRGG